MAIVTIDDRLLSSCREKALHDFQPVIDNMGIVLQKNMAGESGFTIAKDNLSKIASGYAGVYYALRERLSVLKLSLEFQRAYFSYIAGEASLQMLSKDYGLNHLQAGAEETLSQHAGVLSRSQIEFLGTDRQAIAGCMSLLDSQARVSYSNEELSLRCCQVLMHASNISLAAMHKHAYLQYLNKVRELAVHSSCFHIKGITEGHDFCKDGIGGIGNDAHHFHHLSQGLARQGGERIAKSLREHSPLRVNRNEIVGNADIVEYLEESVRCLMHYDPVEMRNPFFGFGQFVLLAGEPGTGKTMCANYAANLANDIAKKWQKPFSSVELEFEDRWQCGPLDNLRHQLREISDASRIYLVYADEFDTRIGSRNSPGNDGYRTDCIGEFLKFRGSGGYCNRGNYMFLATTNQQVSIDPAVLDVFCLKEVQPPQSAYERLAILQANLKRGIKAGYVMVESWDAIQKALEGSGLTGRDLYMIAKSSEDKYRRISARLGYACPGNMLTASQVEASAAALLKSDLNGARRYATSDGEIIECIVRRSQAKKMQAGSYLSLPAQLKTGWQ